MADSFDPYYKWLGIPPGEQPPDHYRLLGTARFETHAEVISEAADRQMRFVWAQGKGDHQDLAKHLLAEISAAKACLLDEKKKATYDETLRATELPPIAEEVVEVEEEVMAFGAVSPALAIETGSSPSELESKRWRKPAIVGGLALLAVAVLAGGFYAYYANEADDTDIAAKPAPLPPPADVPPPPPPDEPETEETSPTDDGKSPEPKAFPNAQRLDRLYDATRDAVRSRKLNYHKPPSSRVRSGFSDKGFLNGLTFLVPESNAVDQGITLVTQHFVRPDGMTTASSARRDMSALGRLVEEKAKHSYVVGGIRIGGATHVQGLQLVYMRLTDQGLDPSDQYSGAWHGGGTSGYVTEFLSRGLPVVGVAQGFENGLFPVGLGIVEAKVASIEAELETAEPNATALSSITAQSLNDRLAKWSQNTSRGAFILSPLVGANRGSVGWTAAAPYYNNDPNIVTGLELFVQKRRGKTVIRRVAAARSQIGQLVGTLQPIGSLKDKDIGRHVRLDAVKGYALGGLRVQAGDSIDGVQPIFLKVTPTGLDADVRYEGPWIGDAMRPDDVQTLGADGNLIVALYGSGHEHLESLSIIQADLDAPVNESIVTTPPSIPGSSPNGAAPPDDEPKVERQPLPAEDALAAARKLVNEVYASELEAAGSTSGKVALAKKMYDTAIDATDDTASQYVLFERAYELVAETGQFVNAWRILDKIGELFETDVLVEKGDALNRGSRMATQTKHFEVIAEHWRQLMDQAIAADQYDLASKAATKGIVAARKAKKPDVVQRIEERKDHIRAARADFAAADRARKALAADPNDAAAATQLGLFFCTRKNDWREGLPLLAKGDDKPLADLAETDLAGAADSQGRLKLGDAWWGFAESKRDDGAAAAFQQRAAFWYRQAVGGLTGLTKARAEKRIAEAGADGADPKDEWTDLIAAVDVSQDALTGIWAVKDGALACAERGRTATLPDGRRISTPSTQTLGFPVGVTGSYDLQAQFAFLVDDTIRILFPIGDKSCGLSIRRGSNWDLGVLYVTPGGRANEQNNGAVALVKTLRDGVPVRVDIRVESLDTGDHRVSVALGGMPALIWQGQPTGSSATAALGGVRTPSQIAVSTYRTAAAFGNVRIRARDGEIKSLR